MERNLYTPLTGGANNRVFLLPLSDQHQVVLKHYFQHPHDLRPRLKTEFSFLTFAWENGIRCIPKPIISDEPHNLALYSYIPGRSATSADVHDATLSQTIDFFLALNHNKKHAASLLAASEACLETDDFYLAVQNRLDRLLCVENPDVKEFVLSALLPLWNKLRKTALQSRRLSQEELCLSPSDFGFHNALMVEDTVYFIDFEYAGWDDPVKTVCDFFCQPKIPIPMRYFEQVCASFAPSAAERLQTMFPICRLKWTCKMLNGFLDVGKARRTFAHFKEEEQLQKTKTYFEDYPWPT